MKVLGNESSLAISLLGAKVTGSEWAGEQQFQGANWPGSYWPIRSRERIGPGAEKLWIKKLVPIFHVALKFWVRLTLMEWKRWFSVVICP